MNEILKIINECPKSWKEFINKEDKREVSEIESVGVGLNKITIKIDYVHGNYTSFNFRNWYDYFDGLGIKVVLNIDEDGDFFWDIYGKQTKGYKLIRKGYDNVSRVLSEWDAFASAFKIREGQL